MKYVTKEYYHAQLPNTKTTLITASEQIFVRSIMIHNSNSSTETVILNYNNGTNDLQLFKIDVLANETRLIEFGEESFPVSTSDIISGSTDTASKVTCTINAQTYFYK